MAVHAAVWQMAQEQAAAMQGELASARRQWEQELAATTAENQSLSRQLLEVQRELQAANGRWERVLRAVESPE